ncbi:tyrosine--tRNA ligase, mitochondrial-like isoform X1 [Macrosteles quadrilineatus]|uniref:tyrosine--tRNA ligase, mitochondrial-like isoform X1 n=2 Tax=Macrosteles quadrilineatus TaxID=74068 RepID=UPI0023E19D48|nr:tyrosine--tRNA ligase, mitochondrial-like isoform X1 [Macrosteles quadrilineatus]
MLVRSVIKCFCKCHPSFVRCYTNRNILFLRERGMFEDIFPDNGASSMTDILNAKPQCVYAGFDPTAKSLHVGNLLVLLNLLHWQRGGHQVIALVGGATGRIGDPSGRSKEREEQSSNVIQDNLEAITRNIQRVFKNHEDIFWKKKEEEPLLPVKVVNNETWYKDLNSLDFICGIGRHFRMGIMLNRTAVATRLKSDVGLSYTEFSYQIFQAYDWYQLFNKYDCRFQIGGSDQMGNIHSGHDYIGKFSKKDVFGLTLPLITTEKGEKFGKSAGNAIWLDPELTSPFELYQFFIRTADADVEKLLKLFTFRSVPSIQDLCKKHMNKPELRQAQKILAEDVTLLVHGEAGLESAKTTTAALYDSSIEQLGKLTAQDMVKLFKGARVLDLILRADLTIQDLAMEAKCFGTTGIAQTIISAGGFYINQKRVTNPSEMVSKSVHILPNNISLLRVGKKSYFIIRWAT